MTNKNEINDSLLNTNQNDLTHVNDELTRNADNNLTKNLENTKQLELTLKTVENEKTKLLPEFEFASIEKASKKTNKKKKYLVIIGIIIITLAYILPVIMYTNKYAQNTIIDGVNFSNQSFKTEDEAREYIASTILKVKTPEYPDGTIIDIKNSPIKIKVQAFREAKSAQNPFLWFFNFFKKNEYRTVLEITEKENLESWLFQVGITNNQNRTNPTNASLELKENQVVIKPEEKGTAIDPNKAIQLLTEQLENGNTTIDFRDQTFKVNKSAQGNEKLKIEMQKFIDQPIKLQIGEEERILTVEEKFELITFNENDQKKLEEEKAKSLINKLNNEIKEKLNSQDVYLEANAGFVNVNKGELKKIELLDTSASLDSLNKIIENNLFTVQMPTVKKNGGNIYYNNRLAEDSLFYEVVTDLQKVFVYNEGELIIEAPVVTGTKGKHDTNKGDFKIFLKQTNTVLDSATTALDQTDKNNVYRVPVKYWMPFDPVGIGFHDVQARDERNDYAIANLYEKAGSHGCINTPISAVEKMFNLATVGKTIVTVR